MVTRLLLSIAALVSAALSIPMILRKVPPNGVYGFRTSLTLSNPDIWYPANAFSGWMLLLAAIVSLAMLWLLPNRLLARSWVPMAAFLVPLGASAVASFLYLRRFA